MARRRIGDCIRGKDREAAEAMSDTYKAHCPCGTTSVVEGDFVCPKCGRKGEIDWRAEIAKQKRESGVE
jgi:hypothetical protein